MRNTMLRNLSLLLLLGAPLLFGQAADKKSTETQAAAPGATQPSAGFIRDDRVSVEDFSFWKKNATDGKGDYLEFTFNIVNKTEDAIPLKMFLIAFDEKDLVDSQYRRYVEYPEWRKFDEDKKMHKLVLFDSIPEMKHDEVASFARKKEETVAKNGGFKPKEEAPASTSKKRPNLQEFIDYVEFIHQNPTAGIDVSLQGYEDTQYNLKCESEAKTGKKCLEKKGKYLIEEKALRTNVWAKLLARYSVDRKFFNYLGVVLYDTEAKKIVHRQFYKINGRFKTY